MLLGVCVVVFVVSCFLVSASLFVVGWLFSWVLFVVSFGVGCLLFV